MANEAHQNHETGATLYLARFQLDGDVFLTNGASDETWGAGGRNADNYDVTMPEKGSSGHYVGDFDTSANISAGVYHVTTYLQANGNPADSDRPIGQGVIFWDGSAEIDILTLDTSINDDIIGADSDTLKSLSDQMDGIIAEASKEIIELAPGE